MTGMIQEGQCGAQRQCPSFFLKKSHEISIKNLWKSVDKEGEW